LFLLDDGAIEVQWRLQNTWKRRLKRSNFKIWVEKDPQAWNSGHAEVMPKAPKGLAHHLFATNFFTIHFEL
jgi:hypothetical protein